MLWLQKTIGSLASVFLMGSVIYQSVHYFFTVSKEQNPVEDVRSHRNFLLEEESEKSILIVESPKKIGLDELTTQVEALITSDQEVAKLEKSVQKKNSLNSQKTTSNALKMTQTTHVPTQPSDSSRQNDVLNSHNEGQKLDEKGSIFYQKIKGELILSDGVAFTGSEILSVYHIYDDHIEQIGDVFIHEGRYSLVVDRRKLGRIVAELRTDQGELLGYGEGRFYKPNIKVKPPKAVKGSFRVLSGYSFASVEHKIKQTIVSKNLDLNDSQPVSTTESLWGHVDISPGSDVLLSINAKEHFSTLLWGQSSSVLHTRLFSQKWVNSAMNLVGLQPSVYTGVIMGSVVDEYGGPLEGVRVSVRGSPSEVVPAFYFSGSIVDSVAFQTDKGGKFLIPNLMGGAHLLDVHRGKKLLFSQVVLVEPEHLSHLRLSPLVKDNLSLSIFDIQTNLPQQAIVSFLSSSHDQWLSKGQGHVQAVFKDFTSSDPYTYLEVDPGQNYLLTRYKIFREDQSLNLPIFSFDWLSQFEFDNDDEASLIVKFPEKSELLLSAESLQNYRPQYFDAKGKPVHSSALARGAILKNLPIGPWSVRIKTADKVLQAQNIIADAASTFVIQF